MLLGENKSTEPGFRATKALLAKPKWKLATEWLDANGFKGIDKGIRSRLLKCLDNRVSPQAPKRRRSTVLQDLLTTFEKVPIITTEKLVNGAAEFGRVMLGVSVPGRR
jgi:hypothetical protein